MNNPPIKVKKFESYENVILTYSELSAIISNRYIYEDWYSALSAVNGIYLLLDKETGKQYVGSTYGKKGIWGRWKKYVNKQRVGVKEIDKLLEDKKDAYEGFQFSILCILPVKVTDQEAVKIESLYKIKLGTRSWGMNSN